MFLKFKLNRVKIYLFPVERGDALLATEQARGQR